MTKKEKWYLLYLFVVVIFGSAIELAAVAVFSPYIEMITGPQTGNESFVSKTLLNVLTNVFGLTSRSQYIIGLSLIIVFIYVFKNIYLAYEKNITYKYSYDMQNRVSRKLLFSYMNMPYTFHLKVNPAELVRSIRLDVDSLTKTVIHIMELFTELLVCGVLGIYLIFVSPIIASIIAIFLAGAVFAYFKYAKQRLKRLGKKNQGLEAEIFKSINKSLGGIKEIRVLERNDYFIDEFAENLAGHVRILRIQRLMAVLPKYCIESLCITGLMIAVIVMMVFDARNIENFVPQIAVFATAAFRLMPSVGRINEHMSAIDSNSASVGLIYHDLMEVERIGVISDTADEKDEITTFDEILVNDLSYRYPDAEKPVFTGVNMHIGRGKTVAFIGESGAGKSTLADIILGLLTPEKGTVTAGGKDIFSNLPSWHKNIGYIPQFIYLSDDTIKKNIAFGVEEDKIDDEKVILAAKKAKLFDFVQTLPDGFETVVGERGARLSGGQRQRIGIARALYHDPEVIVMDEATSALDNDTETAVMESIDGLHGMKTMIIIAHRLSTIRNADEVYEVGGGTVVVREKSDVIKTS
jgi:ABC-type multidrug transport system fused ATPase/permease subunit